jgi:hypothetical protein
MQRRYFARHSLQWKKTRSVCQHCESCLIYMHCSSHPPRVRRRKSCSMRPRYIARPRLRHFCCAASRPMWNVGRRSSRRSRAKRKTNLESGRAGVCLLFPLSFFASYVTDWSRVVTLSDYYDRDCLGDYRLPPFSTVTLHSVVGQIFHVSRFPTNSLPKLCDPMTVFWC